MKKISSILLKIFSFGVITALFAGALASVGFGVAICIGGEAATEICVFIHKTYFPWVIKLTSVFVGIGLVGMYFSKIKALALASDSSEDKSA